MGAFTNTFGKVIKGSGLNQFNPLEWGLVSDAYLTNNVSEKTNIYYKLKNEEGAIDIASPLLDKLAIYSFKNDSGGFNRSVNCGIGKIGESKINKYSNYNSSTGYWYKSAPNYYTKEIGATMSFSFTGVKISFYSNTSNVGGMWRFIVDGGLPIDISVYNSVTAYKTQIIASNLENKEHTVTATFIGQDPNNPVADPRGWAYFGNESTNATFIYNKVGLELDTDITTTSNVEFVFRARKKGETYPLEYYPYHLTLTQKSGNVAIYVDNNLITNYQETDIISATEIKIIGQYVVYNTNDANSDLYTIKTIYTVNKYGFHIKNTITALIDIEISDYAFTMPVSRLFGTLLLDNNSVSYDLTQDNNLPSILTSGDTINSFKVTSSLENMTNYQFCAAITDNAKRIGRSDRGLSDSTQILWLSNNNLLQKLYCNTFRNSILMAGNSYTFESVYYFGIV